jgi:hypothetical protein
MGVGPPAASWFQFVAASGADDGRGRGVVVSIVAKIDIIQCGHCRTPYVRIREKISWFTPCHRDGLAAIDGRVLRCATCSKTCGLMPSEIAAFVMEIVEKFYAQTATPPADA